MDSVWVVQSECYDYYCGCGGGHIIAALDHEPEEGELDRYLGGSYHPFAYTTEIPIGQVINVSKSNKAYT